jgi:hypothetical protein
MIVNEVAISFSRLLLGRSPDYISLILGCNLLRSLYVPSYLQVSVTNYFDDDLK